MRLLLVVLLLSGCGADATCAREPALTWENFGQGFTATWCAGCHSRLLEGADRHGAPEGVDLHDLAGVLEHADRYAARAVGPAPSMPPAGGPGADELLLADEWLSCAVLPRAGR